MTEISEKEVEAACEAWQKYWCEKDVPRNTRHGITAALEAAARVRAEANSVAGSEGTENSFILRAVGDIEDLADDLKGDRGVILEGSAEAIREAGKLWGERVRIIAASAHPAPQPSGTVGVKPLKWDEHPAGGQQAIAAGLGLYRVHANGDDWYLVPDHMGKGGRAAAQADYERRILSALTAGKPEQAVRPSLGIAGYRLLAPGELDAETVERCIKELNTLPWFEDVVSLVDVEAALRALEAQGGEER